MRRVAAGGAMMARPTRRRRTLSAALSVHLSLEVVGRSVLTFGTTSDYFAPLFSGLIYYYHVNCG